MVWAHLCLRGQHSCGLPVRSRLHSCLPPIIKHWGYIGVGGFTPLRGFPGQELYRNPWGFVRMGKILEDLDSMAANVAFFHCHDETPGAPPPPALVTASVDAIEVRHRIAIAEDATMSGQVSIEAVGFVHGGLDVDF